MSRLDYPSRLWHEKEIKSVANVARRDVREFLEFVRVVGIKPEVQEFPLGGANRALVELKERKILGNKVLKSRNKALSPLFMGMALWPRES